MRAPGAPVPDGLTIRQPRKAGKGGTKNLILVTNPLERLNKEIKRRTSVIGIFPNEAAITRLVGALMLKQNDEWAITRRYMSLETVRELCNDAHLDAAQIASI